MDPDRLRRLRTEAAADLIEVFSSIQGEGPRVGERHLFVRFGHCDMRCRYCDTPRSHSHQETARIERTPGRSDWETIPNPVPVGDIERLVERSLAAIPHHAVSMTGGEPLLQPWALPGVAMAARRAGVSVVLETDGNLPQAFEEVADLVDAVSLDWKLPTATGEPARYAEHRAFLTRTRGLEVSVKAVFTSDTPVEEVLLAARAVAELNPGAILVLQPCTPMGSVRQAPSPQSLLRFQEAALAVHRNVRVIPQVHRQLALP